MNLQQFRESIPALTKTTYLNTGAVSPDSKIVIEEMNSSLEYNGYDTPSSIGMYQSASDCLDETRNAIAEFLNADPTEIALTESTGDGISRLVNAISWNSEDIVIRPDFEHPAGILPWKRLERDVGLTVRELETDAGRIDFDDLKEAVEDARLLCISSISWNYGTKLPIAEIVDIAQDAGTQVLVDAVQSVGQTAVDVKAWGADYVAAAGHKWMVGPWGAGYLYVSDDMVDELKPRHMSYRSVDSSAGTLEYRSNAHRLEIGTKSTVQYAGLQTALDTLSALGMNRIEDQIEHLTNILKEELPNSLLLSPTEFESGLVTIADETPDKTVEQLSKNGIQIRSIPSPDSIRVSLHAFNTEADIHAFVDSFEL